VALTPCTDLSAAAWITGSDRRWDTLVTFGPAGLPAYARLRFIPDPAHPGQREADVDLPGGRLTETAQLRAALDTLARHTRTPQDCWFCLWDGWYSDLHGGAASGSPGRTLPPSVLEGPKVVVPERAFYLFRGALADLGDWGADPRTPDGPRLPMPPSPAFIWPADHAWCVADDVDPHWAGIGAGTAAIDELIADPRLDVVRADPDDEPPAYR
jgi:hypothetical protein